MRALLVRLVVTMIGLGVLVAGAPIVAAAPADSWTRCPEAPGTPGIELSCRTITVPRDHANPGNGRTFPLALKRAHRTDQPEGGRIGTLVYDLGGPGAAGYPAVEAMAKRLPKEITDRFDVVGFDPRGVGRSSPVTCMTDREKDAAFERDNGPELLLQACQRKYRDEIDLYSTEQASQDLDKIREAVGDTKLTYLGYSYGTRLGAVYAHKFPGKLRAAVLDGADVPEQLHPKPQADGFARALDNFAAWCAKTTSCGLADAKRTIADLKAVAKTDPVELGARHATPAIIEIAVNTALYSDRRWPALGTALTSLGNGEAKGVFALADQNRQRDASGHYSNMWDSFLLISQADEKHDYSDLAVTGGPRIVVIGTKGDPATPYENTKLMADALGTGVVLTYEGEGHTAYPKQDSCLDPAVNGYLLALRPPAVGTSCRKV
ncbi:alpha/beta hydrolase [Kutzneria viridogrisea]|uniref:Pimeloyl-ACP methyl ester carboxylesterase n=1 Tax=Kutzneria viridogrisea TaxID=47990 RepID=A0ABR6BG28_9PSEU|nr:pimeloyl-ACP methyl ester carboxylesterase [Kutzneria viridogrisea]